MLKYLSIGVAFIRNMKYRIIFNGVVQGVGCRQVVRTVAKQMRLGGIARNLNDGTVEAYIEVVGEKVVDNFVAEIKKICQGTMIDIMKVTVYSEDEPGFLSSRPPADYETFRILHD